MASEVHRTLTIGRPAEQLLRLWQAPDVRGRVFAHLAEVSADGSRWTPNDGDTAWQVEPLEPGDDAQWAWRGHSTDGDHVGMVALRDAPGELGTEVRIAVGAVGDAELPAPITSAALFEVLHRFKSLAETGEIPTLDRNPHARHSGPDPH